MTKTFWLSFCDADRPKGQQSLGAAVVEVTEEMAADSRIDVFLRHPCAQEGAEWLAAALAEAHRTGCNPGGEVMSADITAAPPERLQAYPRNRLMSRAEVDALDRQLMGIIES